VKKRWPEKNGEPGVSPAGGSIVVFLNLFTAFYIIFNGVHGLAKSSALLPFVSRQPAQTIFLSLQMHPLHQGPQLV